MNIKESAVHAQQINRLQTEIIKISVTVILSIITAVTPALAPLQIASLAHLIINAKPVSPVSPYLIARV